MRTLLIAATLLPFAAAAQEMTYARCIDLAQIDPQSTRAAAIRWYEESGFAGALHCEAVALEEIGANGAAAAKLTEAAQRPEMPNVTRVELLVQAAALWRDLGNLNAASGALDTAQSFAELPQVHRERALVLSAKRDFSGARAALDKAVKLDPSNAETLALRAGARRRLGELDGAKADALQAIELRPVSAAAWYELGKAERSLGQKDAARRAWLKTIDLAPSSSYAALARGGLQDMDGGS